MCSKYIPDVLALWEFNQEVFKKRVNKKQVFEA